MQTLLGHDCNGRCSAAAAAAAMGREEGSGWGGGWGGKACVYKHCLTTTAIQDAQQQQLWMERGGVGAEVGREVGCAYADIA